MLNVNDLSFTLTNLFLMSIFFIGANCFVLISGYFGVRFKSKSFWNLIFQMVYWSFLCTVLGLFPFVETGDVSLFKTFITQIVTPWFPQAYLILFILSPLLNAFIEQNNTKSLGRYILLFYAISTIGGYFLHWKDFDEGMSPLSLIGIYLIGAYLRRTDLWIFNMKKGYDLLVWGVGAVSMMVLNLTMWYAGITICPYGYLNPVIICMTVFFFLFFSKIDIGSISWINYVASIVFAVYLAHSHCFTRPLVVDVWRWINMEFGVWLSIPAALLSFAGLFIICLPLDRFRIKLFSWVYTHI